jgi:hypothetical protein
MRQNYLVLCLGSSISVIIREILVGQLFKKYPPRMVYCIRHSGWPDWANFRPVDDCLICAVFLKKTALAVLFSLIIPRLLINFDRRCVWLHFGTFFHKLIYLVALSSLQKTSANKNGAGSVILYGSYAFVFESTRAR